MKKKTLIILLTILISIAFASCRNDSSEVFKASGDKIKVVASFNPIKEISSQIGKEKIAIHTIIPEGTEPHDFKPRAKDLIALNRADIFIYNGLELENWAPKSIQACDNKNLLVVNSSENCDPIKLTKGGHDPHLWLSLKGAQVMAHNIKEALIELSPDDSQYFQKNYDEFYESTQQLYEEYLQKFEKVKNKDFVTGHAAFGYLCREFGLTQKSLQDVFGHEISAKKLSQLIDYCRENNIKTIFVEENLSPKVTQTLAKETGVKSIQIYTINNSHGKSYIQLMRHNLDIIYQNLNQ